MKLAILALPVLLAAGSAFAADPATSSGQTSGQPQATMATPTECAGDAEKYCSTSANAGDTQTCLHGHNSDLSQACQKAMQGSDAAHNGQAPSNGY